MKVCLGLVALTASLLAASGSIAADLYIPPPAPAPAPAFSWDGPYVGAKIGGGVGTESDDLSTIIIGAAADSFSLSGFTAGVYAGNNWQANDLVFGLEGELDYTGLSGSHQFQYEPGDTPFYTGTLSFATDWQAFLKGRLGIPLDRALLYTTAGIGLAHGTLTVTPGPEDRYTSGASASNVHFGGLIGAGAEYAFTDKLSGRAEVDFAGFGAKGYDLGNVFGLVNASWTQTTATVGLSLKF